jgi:hypothetical protein
MGIRVFWPSVVIIEQTFEFRRKIPPLACIKLLFDGIIIIFVVYYLQLILYEATLPNCIFLIYFF